MEIEQKHHFTSTILTVDDQPDDLEILNHLLQRENYTTISARNGKEALDVLSHNHNIDAILLDRMMPVMDGISLLHKIKNTAELADIPVIIQTAADGDKHILEGINAGAFYYITKPFSHKMLLGVVRSAISMSRRYKQIYQKTSFYLENRKKLKNGMDCLQNLNFELSSFAQVKDVAYAASCCFPDPNKVVGSIAELLMNAHEHGNLNISFEEKSALLLSGEWYEEILHRETLPENSHKTIKLSLIKSKASIEMRIKDCGQGFNWRPFMKLAPERAHMLNGRGIYIASLEFNRIKFVGVGNEVVCTYNLK